MADFVWLFTALFMIFWSLLDFFHKWKSKGFFMLFYLSILNYII